jgi:hypothetical protein
MKIDRKNQNCMILLSDAGATGGHSSTRTSTTGIFFLRRGLQTRQHHLVRRGMILILKLLWISALKLL